MKKKEGTFSHKGCTYAVADLQGSYSMSANSDEEVITRDFIASGKADVVCILADSSQLERSLFMLADYAGLSAPCFLVLNMADVAKERGKKIDAMKIEQKLGIPVVLFSATDTKSYDTFYAALERALKEQSNINVSALEAEYQQIEGYQAIQQGISDCTIPGYTPMWLTIKTLEHDKVITAKLKNTLPDEVMEQIEKQTKGSETAIAAGECKFRWIDSILSGAVTETKTKAALGRLDRIYTHKFWGKPAVVLTVLIGLIGAFIPALPIMGIGSGVDALNGIEDIEKPPSE